MYCFFGVLIGTLVGVLPGLGPASAMAILLPATFKVEPVSSFIMLAGIYYGAMYGGSTTSILVNIPGEAASVVTCLDGHQMALKEGQAGLRMAASVHLLPELSLITSLLSVLLGRNGIKIRPQNIFPNGCRHPASTI
jgi:putative tricarboxylic transport membrane protein